MSQAEALCSQVKKMFSTDEKRTIKPIVWIMAIFLVSLVFILDPGYFVNPPLHSDDWNMLVEPVAFGSIDLVDFSDRRPLLLTLFAILSPIFRLQISLYYVVNWLLILLSGIIVYQIIFRAFPNNGWLALPGALIFLIYPVNYARTWLVISINTFALLLGLLVILLMIRFSNEGKAWRLVVANFLVLLSLGTYEAALGIILLASVIIIFLNRSSPKSRRLWILTVPATVVLFMVWRIVIQPGLFAVNDAYLAKINVSLLTLLKRYGQGLFIFLYNWIGPLLLPFGDYKYWVFVGVGAVLLIFLGVLVLRRITRLRDDPAKDGAARFAEARDLLKISGIGFLLWAAGYIPVIALWQPTFYRDGSRVNLAAIPGAALAIVALLGTLLIIILRRKEHAQKWLLIAVIPLVVAGMAYQVHAQNYRQQVWQENQALWQSMFDLVPDIKPGTKMVIVIPGYEELGPFEMLPFKGDWEAESALRVLYNNKDLFAEYYYFDLPGLPDSWEPIGGDFTNHIFVFYDPATNETRLVLDPYQSLKLPSPVENYEPTLRMKSFNDQTAKYRFLVD